MTCFGTSGHHVDDYAARKRFVECDECGARLDCYPNTGSLPAHEAGDNQQEVH